MYPHGLMLHFQRDSSPGPLCNSHSFVQHCQHDSSPGLSCNFMALCCIVNGTLQVLHVTLVATCCTVSMTLLNLNGIYSNWLPVISGVPQGSILGPLLFIVYMNDLDNVIMCDYKMYADDVTLYHRIVSYENCIFLQSNLDSFLRWCSRWQVSLQPHKCEALCITNKCLPTHFIYQCST